MTVEWHPDLPSPAECRSRLERLSGRQREVVGLVAGGWPTKQIARRLGITASTVHNHLRAADRTLAVGEGMVGALVHRSACADDEVEPTRPLLAVVPEPLTLPAPIDCHTMIRGLPAGAQAVMRALAEGCERDDLAARLGLTAGTVRSYVSLAYRAMGFDWQVPNRLAALAAMYRQAYPERVAA